FFLLIFFNHFYHFVLNQFEFFFLPLLSLLFAHFLIGLLRENFLSTRHGKGARCFNNLSLHRHKRPTFLLYRIYVVYAIHLCIMIGLHIYVLYKLLLMNARGNMIFSAEIYILWMRAYLRDK